LLKAVAIFDVLDEIVVVEAVVVVTEESS